MRQAAIAAVIVTTIVTIAIVAVIVEAIVAVAIIAVTMIVFEGVERAAHVVVHELRVRAAVVRGRGIDDVAVAIREPAVDVVRSCAGCPHCVTHGTPPSFGLLRARHSSADRTTMNIPLISSLLRGALGNQDRGIIFVEPAEQTSKQLLFLAEWFVRHGLRDLILPPALAAEWCLHFSRADFPNIFFHRDRPQGLRRPYPMATFLPTGRIPELAAGSICILPTDARDHDRPDRRLADVAAPGARWTLEQFMDRYVE